MKPLDVRNMADNVKKSPTTGIFGNCDMFQLITKAWNKEQGWMKSTKALEIPGVGCVIQVTTQQDDNVAEALTFVAGVKIITNDSGDKVLIKA